MDREDHDHFRTIGSALVARPGGSQRQQGAGSSASGLDLAYCLDRAKLMFSCYRKDEVHDPEIYCAAVAAVLSEYRRDVIDYVTDPRTGICEQQKFLPNIAEISEACRTRQQDRERIEGYEERIRKQTKDTEDWLNHKPSERLKAMGRAWLDRTDPQAAQLSGQTSKVKNDARLKAEALKRLEDEFGIDLIDAVPDAPQ